MVVGSSPTQGSQFFFEKMTELRCVALPFCCAMVVLCCLQFLASLEVILHVQLYLFRLGVNLAGLLNDLSNVHWILSDGKMVPITEVSTTIPAN